MCINIHIIHIVDISYVHKLYVYIYTYILKGNDRLQLLDTV